MVIIHPSDLLISRSVVGQITLKDVQRSDASKTEGIALAPLPPTEHLRRAVPSVNSRISQSLTVLLAHALPARMAMAAQRATR
jgi:hypothetical protein